MKTKLIAVWSAIVLIAFSLAALPGDSAQAPKKTPAESQKVSPQAQVPPDTVTVEVDESGFDAAECQAIQREIQMQLRHVREQLNRAMEEARQNVNAQTREVTERVAAQRDQLRAAIHAQVAAAQAHARAMSPSVVQEGFVFDDGESGWLGVQIAEVTAEKVKELKLAAERGVVVIDVEADSPAAKSGLRANDVITEFNGQHVESTAQFRRLVQETPAGRAASITIWRDGRAQTLTATVGSRRAQMEKQFRVLMPHEFDFNFAMPGVMEQRAPRLGISGEDLSGQLGSYFGAPDGEGVLVREVTPGSAAEKAGMKAGDVIVKLDGERVKSLSELREKLRAKREQKSVSVGVVRKGSEMSMNVTMEQPRPPERRRISRRVTL